jgi:hypothetical protein
MGKQSRSGSGMNILDNISKSLETIFGLKYLNSLMRFRIRDPEFFQPCIRDLGWKKFGSGIQDKHPGSAALDICVVVGF